VLFNVITTSALLHCLGLSKSKVPTTTAFQSPFHRQDACLRIPHTTKGAIRISWPVQEKVQDFPREKSKKSKKSKKPKKPKNFLRSPQNHQDHPHTSYLKTDCSLNSCQRFVPSPAPPLQGRDATPAPSCKSCPLRSAVTASFGCDRRAAVS
jgi:hypothetical protein